MSILALWHTLFSSSIAEPAYAVDFGGSNYLSGQTFSGSALAVDIYYVSGTMPFGLPASTKNTWIHIESTGSFSFSEIGQNFIGRMANLTLDGVVDMSMHSPETAHLNGGSGGDMIQVGTFSRSGRGPEQDNCVASQFDGVADYLKLASSLGGGYSKQVVFSFTGQITEYANYNHIIYLKSSSATQESFAIKPQAAGFNIHGFIPGIGEYDCTIPQSVIPPLDRIIHFATSFDLNDINRFHVVLNGVDLNVSWDTHVNADINFNTDLNTIGSQNTSYLHTGALGEFYFATNYIDLSTNNPFWDSDLNIPKPVRQVLAETGNTSLIAMPIQADDPGKNYGTAPNFTLNGGPLVGARGMSEYLARSAKFIGGYLYTNSFTPIPSGQKISLAFCVKTDSAYSGDKTVYDIRSSGADGIFVYVSDANKLFIGIKDSSNAWVFRVTSNITLSEDTWHTVLFCIDTLVLNKASLYIDDVLDSATFTTFVQNGLIRSLNQAFVSSSTNPMNGEISSAYLINQYIDFPQEENRLEFVDALDYPKDLSPSIESEDIPKPLFYLKFDDPEDLGKDSSGNDNHFTINGTVSPGSDVDAA